MNEKFIRYFNIMAGMIRILLDKGSYKEKDFLSVRCDEDNEFYSAIFSNVAELIERGGTHPANLKITDLNDDFFTRLENLVAQDNVYVLMLLLFYMDRAIVECYKMLNGFEDEVVVVESLNANREETDIYLLKKTRCKWASSQIGNGLSGILHYFYYIDKRNMPGVVIRNHILDSNLIQGIGKNRLRVALSPVTKEKIVEFSEPYERKNEETGAFQKYFRVNRIRNEQALMKMVLDNIYEAGKNNADILVFPEMLGTQSMLDEVLEKLKQEADVHIPALIVFPSIWEKTENDHNNKNQSCVILEGESILFSQHKYCDYKYYKDGKPVFEDINRDRDEADIIHMIHVEGIGRICIIICFDYLDSENRKRIMENLIPTLVCSPSFSTGSFNFVVLAEKYFSEGCNWVWCNTCSAACETENEDNFKIVGVITTLNKRWNMGNEELKTFHHGKTECNRQMCDGCLCYADIPLIVEKEI